MESKRDSNSIAIQFCFIIKVHEEIIFSNVTWKRLTWLTSHLTVAKYVNVGLAIAHVEKHFGTFISN
jgi:hypothetical protein